MGKDLHPDAVEPPRRQRHAFEKVVEAGVGGALSAEQENLFEPHSFKNASSSPSPEARGDAGLGPVGGKPAVRTAVRAVVGHVERGVHGDGAAEAALRQGAGALRHDLDEGLRAGDRNVCKFRGPGSSYRRPVRRRRASLPFRRATAKDPAPGRLGVNEPSTERTPSGGLSQSVPPPRGMRPARFALRPRFNGLRRTPRPWRSGRMPPPPRCSRDSVAPHLERGGCFRRGTEARVDDHGDPGRREG